MAVYIVLCSVLLIGLLVLFKSLEPKHDILENGSSARNGDGEKKLLANGSLVNHKDEEMQLLMENEHK